MDGRVKKNSIKTAFRVLAAVCGLWAALCLAACGNSQEPAPTPEPTLSPEELRLDADKIVISELMIKNRAVLRDEDGDFSDWIELENISGESVNLSGWSISDKADKPGWVLPGRTLGPGERLLLFASGKDRAASLHTDFALSPGETVYLYNKYGYLTASLFCEDTEADVSLCRGEDGNYARSLYPTPGFANTAEGYALRQEGLTAAGPLVINEVVAANYEGYRESRLGYCDWVEIKNISGSPVLLSDYYLSDDAKDYRLWRFPEQTLEPGELLLVCCDDSSLPAASGTVRASFSLNSSHEELYLSGPDYSLVDFVSLRDIPYECSYGRCPGENGWFFFDKPTPGLENGQGYRRVSAAPVALTVGGAFDGVDSLSVELSAEGTIYYSTDCSLPTPESPVYTGPIEFSSTAVIRAIAVEEGAMPSRPMTQSYVLNEYHSLPILSLVSDDAVSFHQMYSNGAKGREARGSLALYEEDGFFSIPCGIRMYGETSLGLPKKNMSVRFRGAYGQASLEYDVYGGGVTEFTNFVLRSGQDYYNTIIRNELGLNLGLQLSDKIMSLRSRYCILYIDGKYWGIYALMEKSNEQHYASLASVSRDSVTVIEAPVPVDTRLWQDVFTFCRTHDLSQPENYAYFCSVMDVDSLIDWLVIEGFTANRDLTFGNLRYCRSTENDGKWRLMLYDLDATFLQANETYSNMFSDYWLQVRQLSVIVKPLLKNDEFVDRFLTRAGEALGSVLTNENVTAEIDRLADIVRPEVARDYKAHGLNAMHWEQNIDTLKAFIQDQDWRQYSIKSLCKIFDLSQEEREQYFGQ